MAAPGVGRTEADAPPASWEDDLKLLAFKTWQRASCPEADTDLPCWEAELWCRACWL